MSPILVERERAADLSADVIANDAVNAEYRHLVLSCGAPATAARPGQFFQILCPVAAGETPFLRRPMSVYGAGPTGIEFLYKVTGTGTRALATLRRGDTLPVFGPLGNGFHLDARDRHAVLVGRGVGLATLAPIALAAQRHGTRVTAFLSARTPELVMSRARLERAGADVVAVTDAEGTSAVPAVEARLRALLEGGVDAMFVCGANRLVLLVQRLAAEYGVRGEVALEQQMACGLGMCYCCVRPFRAADGVEHRRVCWDGPVFDVGQALEW